MDMYLPSIQDKRVGLVVNHTSLVSHTHLVDTLLSLGVPITAIFSPEHGFRGTADDGALLPNDLEGAIPVFSLYGKNKKPSPDQLKDIDIVLFDIQDVGTRFYTYISTMHYVMEACAERAIPIMILDRPNPNGDYVDGPVLDTAFKSFVGMHPIPVVHGLTVGELAQMINGEGWLRDEIKCDLTVIEVAGWSHNESFSLKTRPSPNLPNDLAVKLYPSLCFFEGTIMSVGRGTDFPFQCVGHPAYEIGDFNFTPSPMPGASKPLYEGQSCKGIKFDEPFQQKRLHLSFLLDTYSYFNEKEMIFFNGYFDKLAGTDQLRKQITAGWSETEIRKSWEPELQKYLKIRQKYVLYP